ncbi:MAG: intermembrane transport protein PqiB, partial [Endozoicomonas sp.]
MNTTNVKAIVSSTKNLSAVWIIPIVALIAAGWMIYQYMSQQGPEIHLIVDTAEGVEPDKTLIKVRSVKVGVVTAVELSKDYGQIELTARMGSGTERMLRENSEFWMVKPRVGTQGITGLETLLSGPYIELEPGDANEESRNFVMLNDPPVAGSDVQGAHVVLVADKAGKLAVGDPVMFEGYVVGRVEQASFDVNKRQAIYQLFIFHPYSSLLRTRTRFWLNSGIDISFNAEGFNINFSSLQTLITGGATFGIPEGSPEGVELTSEMHEFQLYDNLQAVHAHMYE